MDQDDAHILDAAMSVVIRYGMKRTTMADIAQAANVSRQTLYDRYGDKDGIMAAAIRLTTRRNAAELRAAFASALGLAEKFDAYIDVIVWRFCDVMQAMPDVADLERGMGPASVEASAEAIAVKRQLLAEMLSGHLPEGGPSATELAAFIELASTRTKMAEPSRQVLAGFIDTLKTAVLALAKPG